MGLDAMHYDRTGKNHNGDSRTPESTDEVDESLPGDSDLWDKLNS